MKRLTKKDIKKMKDNTKETKKIKSELKINLGVQWSLKAKKEEERYY